MSISFTPKGLLNYALNNYRKDKNRNKLAAEINSEIFQSIEWLEDFPLFKKKLTNILVINVSFIFLLSNMIRDLDISHALANQTSIYLRERYYSEWYINKSAGKSAKIIKKKFGLVRNLLRSEFSITTSEVYKDDKYISRFVEHIMLIVFSVPYDKSLYDALIRTYKNVCELQRAYDELSKALTESDDVYTTTAEAHTPTTGTPQSTTRLQSAESSKDRMAKIYNHRILREINTLASTNMFPDDLTSKLLLYFSGVELIQDAVGKLDLTENMALELSLTLNQNYNYSPQFIKKSLQEAFENFSKKKIIIDSFIDAEFQIKAADIYKDDSYIARYADHIMLVVFAMPYNKDVSQALINAYHNISALQKDYNITRIAVEHSHVADVPQTQPINTANDSHQPTSTRSTTSLPQQHQSKPLKSDKTFWSMLVMFGVLPLVFVLCLIWYFNYSYESPASIPSSVGSETTLSQQEYQPTKYIPKIEPNNGQILSGVETQGSTLTVKASATEGCVVKLKNTNNKTVLSFYVKAGCSVTVDVPAQKIYVYFAAGETWYGTQYLFGPNTSYSMDETICNFGKFTYEYTLYEVYNGNFSEKPISADEFK